MKVVAVVLMAAIAIAGCVSQSDAAMDKDVMNKSGDAMMDKGIENGAMMENGTMVEKSFMHSGTVLAGSTSPVVDFNMDDYQSAAASGKLILLYFYANWCPVCRAEVPEMYSAFSELNDSRAIAFRVNFNDDQTDSSEVELARTFGVPYQHTKVIVKNGQVQLKSTEAWNKNRYLFELNKALSMP